MNEPKRPDEQMPSTERVPSYGLLVINHAYNEGEITFLQWMELSREWALKIIEQCGRETAVTSSPSPHLHVQKLQQHGVDVAA